MILEIMDRVLRLLAIACFVGMNAVVVLQVFARFFLAQAPPWTEEIARVFFAGAVAFAAPLAVKGRQYVKVDLLLDKLGARRRLVADMAIDILTVGLLWLVSWVSLGFVRLGLMQRASTLDFPMGIPFASITVASFFIGLYSLLLVVESLRKLRGQGGGP
jgi:TRAP-type transport system small permease protein